MKNQNRGFISTKIILVIIGIIVIGGGSVVVRTKFTDKTTCTQDVKQCSNGSYVKRIAPFCNFAKCPNVTDDQEIGGNKSTSIGAKACRDENYGCYLGDLLCCHGLKEVPNCFEEKEGGCLCTNCGSICRPCGNNICDEKENKCNCPEDCGQPKEPKRSCRLENEMCGVEGIFCCDGLNCKLDGDHPDASGSCTKFNLMD